MRWGWDLYEEAAGELTVLLTPASNTSSPARRGRTWVATCSTVRSAVWPSHAAAAAEGGDAAECAADVVGATEGRKL